MIESFADQGTEDIFHGINTKAARDTLPVNLHGRAKRMLDALNAAHFLGDMAGIPGYRLEKLKGSRKDFYSIRINDQYRILFKWQAPNSALEVQISKHYAP